MKPGLAHRKLSTETGQVHRAIDRAVADGRSVPVPIIREQHRSVSRNFADEISKLNFLNALRVYGPAGPIAWLDGAGGIHVADPEGYAAFLAKANELVDEDALDAIDANDPLNEAASATVPIEE